MHSQESPTYKLSKTIFSNSLIVVNRDAPLLIVVPNEKGDLWMGPAALDQFSHGMPLLGTLGIGELKPLIHIFFAPFTHQFQNWLQRASLRSDGILHTRGHLRVHRARN